MAEENWKSEAKRILKDKYGKATVYTGGTFDLLHRGHINIFRKAKEIGNCLIVAVSTNKLVRTYKSYDPILNYRERAAIVGDDWANRNDIPDGLRWLKEHNKVLFVPYTKKLSTTYIKRKIIKQSYEIIYAEVERKLRNQYNNK